MELTPWPIDVDALRMGDYIDCEAMIDTPVEHRKYGIKLMRIKDAIEKQLASRGSTLHLRIDGNGLRVMTDADLAVYKRNVAYQSMTRMRRAARHLGDVNRDALTEDEVKAHDAHALRIARIVAAMDSAARQRKLPAVAAVQTALPKAQAQIATG